MGDAVGRLDAMLQVGRAFGVRHGMLRLGYELQRGSGLLSWKMRSAQGWDAWNLENIAPGVSAEAILAARRDDAHRFFFADVRSVGASIREIIGEEQKAYLLAEAENILRGRLPYFGALSFDCGFPPRWFNNPVTGQSVSPQQNWTQMRFASPDYGDLKFILEPSRFLFIYPLVRAYAVSGDERYAEAFWTSVEDWACHNPPMAGPLWICGQESSLRILAWSFALHSFIHSASTTSERFGLIVSMIAAHAWRSEQTLGYARSQRSNHLISEAVGLWTAGTLYPELREASRWQAMGAQLLHEAVIDQITPEGVSQQHSFNYQRMILHQLLWTLRLAEIRGAALHAEIRRRAEAGYDFMRTWVDEVSGAVPDYGSDDGSLIFPLASADYRDFRPTIQLGAAFLKRRPLAAGAWNELAIWFGADCSALKGDVVSPAQSAETGYYRLGDETSWALIRAGHYTRRPFQADQLHVDLWWKGKNLALDPGSYLYNGPAPWNNGLAATAVHNTISVDGRDQMRRAGPFLWLDWAQAKGRVFSSHGVHADYFEGEHDGYHGLGVTHRRWVRWLPDCGWAIIDDIEGSGEHRARLHWLLVDLPYEVTVPSLRISMDSGEGKICWHIFSSVEASHDASVERKAAVIRGGKQQTGIKGGMPLADVEASVLGWYAPTYGELKPAVSAVYETCAQLPIRFVTIVLTNDECVLETEEDAMTIVRKGEKIGSVSLAPEARSASPESPIR